MNSDAAETPRETVIALHDDALSVETRRTVDQVVRVRTITREREETIDQPLLRERVEIERVPIGRPIDAIPPTREEGDVTILPVVEEILVIERRLVLKEEVRIRRIRTVETHRETVTLRQQDAVVTRVEAGPNADGDSPLPLDPQQSPQHSGHHS